MAKTRRKHTKRVRQFANGPAGLTGIKKPGNSSGPYPAPTPKNPPMRTVGEPTISTERVQMSVRLRFNPLRGLTPDRLAQYLDQFDLGFFRMAAITWDKLERRNSTLKTVVPKRKKAVARHGWEVITVENIPDGMEQEAQEQKEALQFFYNNLTATDALKPDQVGGLALLARQMMDAQCKYYAVHEIVWQPGEQLTAQFVFCPLWWFEGTTGKLRYMDSEFQVYGRDMLPGEWLVTCGDGLMEAASVCYIYLSLTLTDWLGYCEKFGQPFIDAATSASPGTTEWEALKTYVENFGPDGGGVRSQSATLELVQPNGTASVETYVRMVEHMERQMTILFRGGDLGTSGKKDATGASLQEGESDILEDDDCTVIEDTLGIQVSRLVINWTRGPDVPVLAYLKFRRSEKDSTESDLKVDDQLLRNGFPMTLGSVAERFDRPLPEDADPQELMRGPAPSPLVNPNNLEPGTENLEPEEELANESQLDLAQTLHEMILPILRRLEAIGKLDDATMQQHMLEKLLKDFPQIAEAITQDNSLARKLSPKLEAALLYGLNRKSPVEMGNGDLPGHEFRGNQYTDAVGKIDEVLKGNSDEAVYADVHPETAAKIKEATGMDVSGHKHVIDREALIHIHKTHGVGREKAAGHEAVTRDDIEKIPHIVHQPDKVEAGEISKRGSRTVKYTKRFNGTTYYVEEERTVEKVLAAKTMYKHSAPGPRATPKGGGAHTS